MPFKPVMLWTDILIDVLVIFCVIIYFMLRNKEYWRNAVMQLTRNRLGMASLVILFFYIMIGLIDSLHFRVALEENKNTKNSIYSTEVNSVLDYILAPLGKNLESTYSPPFATNEYSHKLERSSSGKQISIYPRLKFGGANLVDPEREKKSDIVIRILIGFFSGVALWLIVSMLILFLVRRQQKKSLSNIIRKIVYRTNKTAWLSFFVTLFIMLVIICVAYSLSREYHILGTDKIGQDVFYQSMKSIRTGLVIGTLTTLVTLPFALILGLFSGYFGGRVDDVIQYIYTTLNSIPSVLLIAASVLSLQIFISNHDELFPTIASRADARLLALCFILGMTSWTGLCRLLRAETLKLRELDFIQAARGLGVKHFKIIKQHILPNVMHLIIIAVVLDFSGLVLAEAVLSYVGVGVDATTFSWGNMINAARLQLARDPVVWWPLVSAFIFMFVLVLAANLFSDAVRDAFDPRIRSR